MSSYHLLTRLEQNGFTPFQLAEHGNHLEVMKYLKSIMPEGIALIKAAEWGDVNKMKEIVETEALLDVNTFCGEPSGVRCCHVRVVSPF